MLVMMGEHIRRRTRAAGVSSTATLRTTLALRQCLFTNPCDEKKDVTVFPVFVVLQMLHRAVRRHRVSSTDGKDVVIPMV